MIIAGAAIYRDKKGEVVVFPYWNDNFGISRQSEKYEILKEKFNEQEFGCKILNILEVSKKNEQEEIGQNAFAKASGLKSWNAFQKKYESVEIWILDTGEWKIARLLKQKDHSYGLDKDEVDKYTKIFPEALPAEELGKVVLEMFAMK